MDWQLTDSGVRHIPTGFFVQPDSGGPLAAEYRDFVRDGGAPNPITDTGTLEQRKAQAQMRLAESAQRVLATLTTRELGEFHYRERLREAREAAALPSPSPAAFPLLAAEVPSRGPDVATIATLVQQQAGTEVRNLARLRELHLEYVAAVETAADVAAVNAAVRSAVWTPWLPRTTQASVEIRTLDVATLSVPNRINPTPGAFRVLPLNATVVHQ